MAYHNKTHNGGIDYGPSDTDKLSDPARKRFDVFIKSLHKYRDALSPSLKLKMSDRDMKELAMSLLDDTVFDIVQELEDIQSLTERQLLNKRMKVVGQHKTIKLEMTKRHRDDVTRSERGGTGETPGHLTGIFTTSLKTSSDIVKVQTLYCVFDLVPT